MGGDEKEKESEVNEDERQGVRRGEEEVYWMESRHGEEKKEVRLYKKKIERLKQTEKTKYTSTA